MSWGTGVALAALLLSAWNFYAAHRRGQSKLRIVGKNGVVHNRKGVHLVMTVQNQRPVGTQVRSIHMQLKRGETIPFLGVEGEKKIPCDLGPYQSATFWTPIEPMVPLLRDRGYGEEVRIKLVVEDGAGRQFKGKCRFWLSEAA